MRKLLTDEEINFIKRKTLETCPDYKTWIDNVKALAANAEKRAYIDLPRKCREAFRESFP